MGKLYLTTTLPYVNAAPHIGFALELVHADAYARFHRASGDDVFFNTGTDEHGQKIDEAAKKAGENVQAYVDRYAQEVLSLRAMLNLSTDAFVRTTDPGHIAAAQEMWRRCAENGDIYEKEYEGWYCVGHEAFITEKDLVDGLCPEHGTKPELVREKNYFFRFSRYQDYLLAYLARPNVIVPEWRRAEAKEFVKGGLEDFSISREKARLSWGVAVPNDDTQVMYVWFDALTNYISTLGWPEDREGNFKTFWEEGRVVQMAGKDQVRFQSLMWQAMLKSAGIKATDQVFYHGFITSEGKKMSKSLGNVISPSELVKRYGTEGTRYALLRHVNATDDSDVTWERLDEWYTAGLANGVGNLVARVMKLAADHLPTPVVQEVSEAFPATLSAAVDAFEFNRAMDVVWGRIQKLDEYITETEPYKLVKSDPEKGKALLHDLVAEVYSIAVCLAPFMPETSKKITAAVLQNRKPENLFPRLA